MAETRTAPGSSVGGGVQQRLERLAAKVGRGVGDAATRVGQVPDETFVEDAVTGTTSGGGISLSIDLPDGHLWGVTVVIEAGADVTDSTELRALSATVTNPAGAFLPQTTFTVTLGGAPGVPVSIAIQNSVFGMAQGSFTVGLSTGASGSASGSTGSLSAVCRWIRPLTADELLDA